MTAGKTEDAATVQAKIAALQSELAAPKSPNSLDGKITSLTASLERYRGELDKATKNTSITTNLATTAREERAKIVADEDKFRTEYY